ncbi:MAG: hypothetical protein ACKO5K_09400 [Armatimonadota bacterium]
MDPAPWVFAAALLPVLGIGGVLVDLLLRDAPRRGKRPDLGTARPVRVPPPGRRTCVLLNDGGRVIGTPWSVAWRLGVPAAGDAMARRRIAALGRTGAIAGWIDDGSIEVGTTPK